MMKRILVHSINKGIYEHGFQQNEPVNLDKIVTLVRKHWDIENHIVFIKDGLIFDKKVIVDDCEIFMLEGEKYKKKFLQEEVTVRNTFNMPSDIPNTMPEFISFLNQFSNQIESNFQTLEQDINNMNEDEEDNPDINISLVPNIDIINTLFGVSDVSGVILQEQQEWIRI